MIIVNKLLKYIFFTILITQGLLMSAILKNTNFNNTNIPIIFEKHKTLPIFNLQLVFQDSGYINDIKKSGITNITAKILNEGTLQDGAVNFARDLENNAISIETSTGFETFVIEISCLSSEYKLALNYLNKLLKNPNLTNETLEKIKTLQLSKLQQKQNDFDYIASLNLKSLTYKNTPLQYGRLGTQKSIKDIELQDIKNNISKILNLDNLIIVVGGDIKLKEFKNNITKILKNIKPQGKTTFKKIKISNKIDNIIVKKDTQQSYIYFSSPFNIDVDAKNNYKAKVASFILGGSGFGSRLMEEIRVKNGLAYSAYGNITNKKSYSNFTGYLQTKIENTTKAKKMVSSIIKEFIKNGVTQKELDAAKNFLSGSEPLRSETFSQRLNRAFHLYYQNLSFNYPKEELDMIMGLTLDDLNKFIKSHKELENLSFSIVTK